MRVFWALTTLLVAPGALPIEAADTHALDVRVEPIADEIRIDGLEAHIQHASGPDIPRLASRIEQRWRTDDQVVQRLHHQGWQVVSRLRGGFSEVIQWREAGAASRLVFSTVALRAAKSPAAAPFALPAACAWGRTVEGASDSGFQQRTARCRGAADRVIAALRAQLIAQGWRVQGRDTLLTLEKGGWNGEVIVDGDTAHRECWLVWVGTQRRGGSRP